MDNPDLFEGDMILTPDQRMAAELGLDVAPIGRAAIKGRQWPRGVMIYAIDRGLGKFVASILDDSYYFPNKLIWQTLTVAYLVVIL